MKSKLHRTGTIYLPVSDVDRAAEWYVDKLEAELSYKDDQKAILNFANQSFFLVKAKEHETANFFDVAGKEWFSVTFEVNGRSALEDVRKHLKGRGVEVSDIEDRGHPGRNFVFYDMDRNLFDVWSELSPVFKENYKID